MRELLGYSGPLTHRQYLVWQEWLRQQGGESAPRDLWADPDEREAPESIAARDKAALIPKLAAQGIKVNRVSREEMERINALSEWEAMQERRRLANEAQKRKAGA